MHIFLKLIIFGKQKVEVVFHDKNYCWALLAFCSLSVRPVMEAFNMDCSLPKGNVCHNFVVIILKSPSVSKFCNSCSASNSKLKNKGPKSSHHGTFIYEALFS